MNAKLFSQENAPKLEGIVFKPCDVGDLPEDILKWEDNFGHTFTSLDSLERSYVIHHDDRVKTFVLERQGFPQPGNYTSQRVFFIDYVDGMRVGFIEIDCSTKSEKDGSGNEIVAHWPYVVKIFTTPKQDAVWRQKGLGTKRLQMANEYCIKRFGVPLHSGYVTSELGYGPWRRLLQEGLVEETEEGYRPSPDHSKFKFKVSKKA